MKRMIWKSILFLLLAATASSGLYLAKSPAVAEAVIVDRIVARVNNEIVTLHDLQKSMTPYLLQNGLDPSVLQDRSRRDALMREALKDLVDEKLLLEEAKKLDMAISDEEVDQWLAYTRQQQGMSEADFNATLSQYGLNPKNYREVVRNNLLRIRLINVRVGSQINISDSEIDAAYRQRFGSGGATEPVVTISHIVIRPESTAPEDLQAARAQAEALRERLLAGEDFATLAREESQGPGAEDGGNLGTFQRGELAPGFEEAAFALEVGEYSPVVETPLGFHVVTVTKREERVSTDVEEKKARIRAELHQRAMERQLEIYLQNLRTRSFIEVKY